MSEEEEEFPLDRAFLARLSCKQLRDRLAALGLPTKGRKSDLVSRLLDRGVDAESDPLLLPEREQQRLLLQQLTVPQLKSFVRFFRAGFASGTKDEVIERILNSQDARPAPAGAGNLLSTLQEDPHLQLSRIADDIELLVMAQSAQEPVPGAAAAFNRVATANVFLWATAMESYRLLHFSRWANRRENRIQRLLEEPSMVRPAGTSARIPAGPRLPPNSVGLEVLGPKPWLGLGISFELFEQVFEHCKPALACSRTDPTKPIRPTVLTPPARVAMIFDWLKHGHDCYTLGRIWGGISEETARQELRYLLPVVTAALQMISPISFQATLPKLRYWAQYTPRNVSVGVDCSIHPILRRPLEHLDYRGDKGPSLSPHHPAPPPLHPLTTELTLTHA